MFKIIKLSIAVVVTAVTLGAVPVLAAGSAHLSMSPTSGSKAVGTTFAITIYETSTDAVNVVQPDLSFNQSLLQFNGLSCNTAAFEFTAPGSCGTATPKTGTQTVGTANFKVLAAGNGTVNFATSSHIYSSSNADVWDGNTNGASYTFTPASGGKGGGSTTSAAKPKVLAAATPAPTPAPAPTPEPAKTEQVTSAPAPTSSVAKATPRKRASMAYSIAFIALVVLGVIAVAKSEELGAWLGTQRKKLMAGANSSLAAPAAGVAAVAASKKTPAKKKPSAKKKPGKKTSR